MTRKSMRRTAPAAVGLTVIVAVTVPLLASDQDVSEGTGCRTALRAQHETGGLWWRIGQRPSVCSELSNNQFTRVAAEVTGDSPWDRCRSDLHALFTSEHTWAEPGRFPDSCRSFHKEAFDQVALEAGQWRMQDEYIAHGWPVEVIGTPTSRASGSQ